MGIFTCAGVSTIVSPIAQILASEYPQASVTAVRSITTIPSLVSFFLSVAMAPLIGRYVSYKAALLGGAGFCLVGGLLPVFFDDRFSLILLSRVIFGIGFAVFGMRNAIVPKVYPPQETAVWMGRGMFIQSLASVILQLLSGALGDRDWHNSFWLHLVCLIPLLLVAVFFREPERPRQAPTQPTKRGGPPPLKTILYAVLVLVISLCVFPILSSIALFINERGFGSAAEAGFATSAFTLGTGLLSIRFGLFYKKCGRWLISISSVIAIAGFVLILISFNVWMVVAGAVCCGAGFSLIMLTYSQWTMDISPESSRILAMTLIPSFVSGGTFLSSYFITFAKTVGAFLPLFRSDLEKAFAVSILIYLTIGLWNLFLDRKPTLE